MTSMLDSAARSEQGAHGEVVEELQSLAGANGRRRRRDVAVWFATGWIVLLVGLAVFADLLPLEPVGVPVGQTLSAPHLSLDEPLGTDGFGRSETSRIIYGARVSLTVGVLSVALGLILGGLIGTLAGYFRGWVDTIVNVVVDAWLAFPALVFLLALASVFEPSIPTLTISIGILVTPLFARLARANALKVSQSEFVTAARLLGAGHGRILLREVTPNVLRPVATYAFTLTGVVIVAEASLSFLGLGVQPPKPTWGNMIADGQQFLATDPWVVFVPAIVLVLTVFSFNVLGDYALARVSGRGDPR
jgi:peptide/nickel transport system permease protein